MRFFLELSYNGGAYSGWQRQPNALTVQECIEKALSVLLRREVAIVGAGRTDAGVHASYYVAHFDSDVALDCEWLHYKMNILLPHDIAVSSIREVSEQLHARFSATMREYTYIIEPKKNPFTRHTSWQFTQPLDIDRMNEAAATMIGEKDFTTFAKLGSDNKTNICRVSQAEWRVAADGSLHFTIRANRFLRNMIRAVVGTLVDVGKGRYSVAQFREILESQDLSRCSTGAPAQGLFLSDIRY
ncbi:MAG: tRNA pseudouridine(38-40) synthase TruA [Rikenellaceae bacterium]